MPTRATILAAADDLFYRQGYADTSFADIAAAVGISRGNFYYHFKTKDEILDAVIGERAARTQALLAQWEIDAGTPAACLHRFVDIFVVNRAKIMQHGCPVGTLCAELAKLNHAALPDAGAIFTLFRVWLARHLEALGCAEPDAQALHLLAHSQGIATLASTFRDEAFIDQEIDMLHARIDQIASAAIPPTLVPEI